MRNRVKLTERDLTKLIRRVINEQMDEPSRSKPYASHPIHGGKWYDSLDREMGEPTDYSEEREFGPDEYDSFMEYINDCDTRWCLKTKRMYDMYASKGNIKVRK